MRSKAFKCSPERENSYSIFPLWLSSWQTDLPALHGMRVMFWLSPGSKPGISKSDCLLPVELPHQDKHSVSYQSRRVDEPWGSKQACVICPKNQGPSHFIYRTLHNFFPIWLKFSCCDQNSQTSILPYFCADTSLKI